MASKKELKQNINSIAGELFTECLFCRLYVSGVDSEKADELLTQILEVQAEYINRANRPDGNANPKLVKAYYRKLKQSLLDKVEELGKAIAGLTEA